MQRCTLRGLAEKYSISQIPNKVIKQLSLSRADVECLHIVHDFVQRFPVENINKCIQLAYSKRENEFLILNEEEFVGMGWESFLPYHICFDCDEIIALVVVLKYMNQIRATFEDIQVGFRELIRQICKNEKRYNKNQ